MNIEVAHFSHTEHMFLRGSEREALEARIEQQERKVAEACASEDYWEQEAEKAESEGDGGKAERCRDSAQRSRKVAEDRRRKLRSLQNELARLG